ncbi:hypothetical protein ACFODZ_13085 [Marinicella sediminis]|uniref:Uncharacterized protein n=1 Tax=Marinicella sediminis TaxID=1792834 RepID=A0ABV7JAQ4_9GAMM|nr:hypothetical protein [Marinicella sediminis]
MNKKLNKVEQELSTRVASILWKDWDPIGVYNEQAEWDDEYAGYVPSTVKLLLEGCDTYKMLKHLTTIASVNMGLSRSAGKEHNTKIASLLIHARDELPGG